MVKLQILIAFVVFLVAKSTAYSVGNNEKKIVCYFGSWATYRDGDGHFDVEEIDPMMCTHLMYGFAGLNGTDNKIISLNTHNDFEENWGRGAYRRFTNLKLKNPKLKTLLAIGGWNEESANYSRMAATAEGRQTFIESVIPFLQKEGFDGLDLDWEYPTQRGGVPADRENFAILCEELRAEFDKHNLLLTAAVSAGQFTIEQAYDVPRISESLHFINVMAYDFRGVWPGHPYTGHHAAFDAMEIDVGNDALLNVKHSMEFWRDSGAPAHKLILGLPTYGRGWVLEDPSNTGFYSPSNQPIQAGRYTGQPGFWGYNEICEKSLEGGWTPVHNEKVVGPYAYKEADWIGFDDEHAIRYKSQWALDNGFGGAMFWSLETDDFQGKCGGKSALIKTAYRTLIGEIEPEPTTTQDPNATTTPPPPTPPSDLVCTEHGQRIGEKCSEVYWICMRLNDDWDHVPKKCPDPLLYDPATSNCNWDYAIGCDSPQP